MFFVKGGVEGSSWSPTGKMADHFDNGKNPLLFDRLKTALFTNGRSLSLGRKECNVFYTLLSTRKTTKLINLTEIVYKQILNCTWNVKGTRQHLKMLQHTHKTIYDGISCVFIALNNLTSSLNANFAELAVFLKSL